MALNSKTAERGKLKFGQTIGQIESLYLRQREALYCTYNFRGQKLSKSSQI